jgi:hypothetical protein
MFTLTGRKAHGRVRRRRSLRRVKRTGVYAAACCIVVASMSTTALGGDAIVSAARDVASLIRDRSPGPRTSGILVKNKSDQQPRARALANTRSAPIRSEDRAASPALLSITPELPSPDGPPILDNPALATALAPPALAGALGSPVLAGLPESGFGGVGIGGGGFGGGGGGGLIGIPDGGVAPPGSVTPPGGATPPSDGTTPPASSPPLPVSAVPEPSTWMMMILGFGAIGFSLRRKRQSSTEGEFKGSSRRA